ncbi:MAG: hypothetical protein H6724_08520 [Sandaracinus sp.]|nr:hypothetical protein [Sandaracinus sp.]
MNEQVREALAARDLTLEDTRAALDALATDAERDAWIEEHLGDLALDLDLPAASALPALEDASRQCAGGWSATS